MDKSLFIIVKESVTQWLKDNKEKFKNKHIEIEIVDNTKEQLYIILNFGECMAAIVVAESDFAPYRFISFEVAAIENGIPIMLYSWYDKEGDRIEEITKNLDKGIGIALEYNNPLNKIANSPRNGVY